MRFKLYGFPISLHYSWFIGFSLLTWLLYTTYFKDTLADLPFAYPWASAGILTLLVLASVFLHELAHAVTARYFGYKTKEMILHILGGWTVLERPLPTPRMECLFAMAGPLCSLGLAALLWPFSADPFVRYLYKINLVLGAYNLFIPCIPLDGGHVLRAWLWTRTSSYAIATEQAAIISKQVSSGIMGVGVLSVIFQYPALWLIVIGILLRVIADSTYKTVQHSARLTGPVRDIMVPSAHVLTIPSTASMTDLQTLFLRYGHRCYPVWQDDQICGLVHYETVREDPHWLRPDNGLIAPHIRPLQPALVLSSTATQQQALDRMMLNNCDELLVFDGKLFTGLVSRSTVTRVQNALSDPKHGPASSQAMGFPLWQSR